MPYIPYSVDEIEKLKKQSTSRYIPYSSQEIEALKAPSASVSASSKGVTGTTTKVSATSTGKLPAAEPYQVPLPDAMISVSKGRNVASQLPMSPDEFVNAPDFSEKSLPNPVKNTAWHAGLFTPEYDKNYMYINDVNGARDKISREATIKSLDTATMFDDGTPSQVKKGYDYITGDEVKIYNYLYASYGKEAAENYLDSLNLTERARAKENEAWKSFAEEHPVGASAASVALGVNKGAGAVDNAIRYLSGKKIDPNSYYNQYSQAQSTIRGTVSQDIEETLEGNWGKAGSFGYQVGMSMADFLASMAVGGGNQTAILGIMGSGAAADTVISGKEKGLPDNQAFLLGAVAGAAEAVFEKIPLENLFSIGNKAGVSAKVLEVLKQMGIEGAEEVGTDVANAIADGVISGNKSDYNLSVRAYMESGLSEAEARNKAAADFAKQIGMSFAGGAISGGVLGTGAELINFAGSKKANASTSDQWTNGTYADTMEKTQAGGGTDGRAGAAENLGGTGGVLWESGQGTSATEFRANETDTGFYERIPKNAEGAEVGNASGGRTRRTIQVGDRTYAYDVVPSAEQSAQAKQTQTLLAEYGIPSEIVYWSQSSANGITQTMQGEASTLRNGTVLIRNGAGLQARDMAGHEMAHVAAKKSPAEYQKYYDAVVDEIDFNNRSFSEMADLIIENYFTKRGKEFDFTRDYPALYKELVGYISGNILADESAARQRYSPMLYNFDAVLEAWKRMDTAMREYGKSTKKTPKADSGNTGSAFFDADSKDSTDNIDAIVRDVFGYGQQTDAQANPGNGDVQSDKWSKPESQWTAENQNADTNEGAAIKSVTEIVQKIRNAFGIPISTGKFNQRAYGIYKTRAEAIRTKVSDALPTIAHELGHHFDKRYGLYILPSTNEAIQVLISTRPEFAQSYEVEQLPGEAVAEFMRDYLTDRTLAKSKYPAFYDAFVKALPEDQIKKLNSIGDDINRYMFADLHERAKANIVTREESQKIYRSQKSLGDLLTRAKELFSDTAAKVELFGKGAHDRYWISKDVDGMIERMIAGEYMTDIDGKPVEWPDETGHVKPVESLARIMSEITESQKKEFDAYLTYRHGLEFLANGKRVFADDRLNNSEYMRSKMASMESEFPAFKDTAEKIYRWHDIFMRKWVVEPGLITKEAYELLRKKYPSYVPFYRAVENGKGGARGSVANQNSPIKRARGSGKAILSPVENICVSVDKCVKAADRNAVMQVMAKALRENDGLGYLMEEVPASRIPKTVSSESVKQKISKALKDAGVESDITEALNEAIGADVTQWVVNPRQGADIVWMIEDGKKKYFQIHDKGLMAALTNLTPYQANGFFSVLGTASRAFKALNTGANPIWAAQSNAIRDFFTTWHYGSENNPIKFMGQYIKAIVDTVNGLRGKEGMYSEYRAGGGGKSASISNPKQIKSVAQDLYKQDRGGFRKVLENRIRILEAIEAFSDVIETAPRLAEYTRQRKQGVDIRHSVLAADEVSVNFKRKGQMSPQLDAVYPYFNASVQGISKMIRFAKSNPKAFWTKHITTSLLLAALVIGWNKFFMDDEDEYEKLSNYMKNNYYCFSVGDGKFVRIAKAKELAVLESLIERTYEAGVLGNDQAFGDFANYTALQFLPPGVPTPEDPLAPVSDMIGVGTVVDLAANKNFSGAPIVPSQYQKLEPYAQYNDKTSWFAKAFGQAMGLSPMQIDYVISDNLGIIGNLNKALGANDKDWSLGILNKATADNAYSTDVLNNFYDTLEELEMRANTNPRDGHAVGMYKQYQSMQSIISQLNKFGRESKDDERTFKATARDYASAFHSSQAGKIDERLIALYERTQSKSVFPYKTFSASFTKDGKTVNLTPAQFLDYVDEYERTLEESYQKILNMNISDEKKVEKLEKAKRDLTSSMNKKYGGGSSGSDKLKVPTYEETAIDRLLKGALS
nr:MAG TPA: Large polyvalent protein associated domain 38 [Caudoviricetes sp.]